MSEVIRWAETPAGMLANGGWRPEDRAVEWAAKEADRVQARAEFDAAVAADPQWSASRRLQQALADRGWTGQVVNIGPSIPLELQPLHTARLASQQRQAMFYDGGHGWQPMEHEFAAEIQAEGRARTEAAQAAMDRLNAPGRAARRTASPTRSLTPAAAMTAGEPWPPCSTTRRLGCSWPSWA